MNLEQDALTKARDVKNIFGMIANMYDQATPVVDEVWSDANPESFALKKQNVDKYSGFAKDGLYFIGNMAEGFGALTAMRRAQELEGQRLYNQ